MGSQLTLVIIGKDWEALREFSLQHVNADECILVSNEVGTPLSAIGNYYLEHANNPVLGILHADSSLGPGACDAFVAAANQQAIVGIVGRDVTRRYIWCNQGGGPVETLDCCSIFLRRDLELAFDETNFDGLHCYIEDMCMQARARGLPVFVPVAEASHRGNVEVNGDRWLADYSRYRGRLERKWGAVVTT